MRSSRVSLVFLTRERTDIPAGDISNILGRLSTKPYISQEVIWGSGEPILPSEYVGNGDVQECVSPSSALLRNRLTARRFRYTTAVKNAFQSSGISSLQNPDSSR